VLLLHEVFGVDHAEIARARGKTEATSRQQLRRALLRLRRQAGNDGLAHHEGESDQEAVFRNYLQSLRLHDPQTLWAMLRQPPISARADAGDTPKAATAAAPRTSSSVVTQVGGQLGLVLTLDGVTLCVLPLGTRAEQALEPDDQAARRMVT
jgi:RNA polymerase sigma-70 factor (ECF subfamily)